MTIEIWWDVLYPRCSFLERRLTAARERVADPAPVAWRSFEILPDQPRVPGETAVEMINRHDGTPIEEVSERFAAIDREAAAEGVPLDIVALRPVSSFDAHRLAHHAHAHGRGEQVVRALLDAYLAEHANVADHDVLAGIAVDAGLDGDAVRALLAGDEHADAVRADEARAAELGVTGVPSIVVDGRVVATEPPSVDELVELLSATGAEAGR